MPSIRKRTEDVDEDRMDVGYMFNTMMRLHVRFDELLVRMDKNIEALTTGEACLGSWSLGMSGILKFKGLHASRIRISDNLVKEYDR